MNHSEDDFDYQQAADDVRLAKAIMAGEVEFTDMPDGPEADALLASLPPPGAPVMVVRPVRLPFEADQQVQALAKQRGISVSEIVRSMVLAALAEGDNRVPAIQLQRGLELVREAFDALDAKTRAA